MTSRPSGTSGATSHATSSRALLTLGALGIVFGDIGTSPLYALGTAFTIDHGAVAPTPFDVYGVVSMVVWSIVLVVTYKYVYLAMRADNDGEGGILALVALLRRTLVNPRSRRFVLAAGMLGAALFYGDSLITPAISVLSAMEGLEVVNPELSHLVVPLALAILVILFVVQRWGTATVGRAFGPVMALWFAVLAVLGVHQIVQTPEIVGALLPTHAIAFVITDPFRALIALGAVVLTITGAEALYADMGHFGAPAIRRAWAWFVFPALVLTYLGQGALVLRDPGSASGPFYAMAPAWALPPLVVLATAATVIASQAVISGAFSVTYQAVRLGLLPRFAVRYTSRTESGQIYLPAVNGILLVGVAVLVLVFRSSERLAGAYGLAVTGTLVLTSVLFLTLAVAVWRVPMWRVVVFVVLVGVLELVFLAANLLKIVEGGWLPLLVAALVVGAMLVWRRGTRVLQREERQLEGPIGLFAAAVQHHGVRRVPGIAVYPHASPDTLPLALRWNLDFNQVVHEHAVLVQLLPVGVPHVRHAERAVVTDIGTPDDGIVHVGVRVGFTDSADLQRGLALAVGRTPELDIDLSEAHYFLSQITVRPVHPRGLRRVLALIFAWMYHRQPDRTEAFHLPRDRTVALGARVDI